MQKFKIYGMSCAACSSKIENSVSKLDGVEECNVSIMTNSMTVKGNISAESIIAAVERIGYKAEVQGKTTKTNPALNVKNNESKNILYRMIASAFFLLILMYFTMGHTMLGLPVFPFLSKNPVSLGLLQLIFSAIILLLNRKFFINGFKGIISASANMDTLVALGSGASFVYSVYLLFHASNSLLIGDLGSSMIAVHNMYFESAAMILVLVSFGKFLESRSKEKTMGALEKLINLKPKQAVIIRNEKKIIVSCDDILKGDIFVVKPGESMAVDGVVIKGNSAVDESALTGESIPVDKGVGSRVFCGTVNVSGYLECEATEIGEGTTLSKIIQTVNDTAASKAPIARIADKVSAIFVPAVISIAVVTLIIWLIFDYSFGFALKRAISVLVISCPCALGLATPVAITVGNGVAARNGILFKNAKALETCGRIKSIVLDKTGTITKGKPVICDIYPCADFTREELIKLAYSLEKHSEHPLSKAVCEYSEDNDIEALKVENFENHAGLGLSCQIDCKLFAGGKLAFIEEFAEICDREREVARTFSGEGKTPLFFAFDNKLIGIIAVADSLKDDSKQAIGELRKLSIEVTMLTGDNEITAKAISTAAGINDFIAEVLPTEKSDVIKSISAKKKVAMVGDGINDAPALTTADIGMAIGAGSDIAIDAADVVLMNNSLQSVVTAIKLGRATLRNIKENLFWAFFYNILCIPLAAGVFIPVLKFEMSPMIAAAAMSLSSVCVISNSLRLNLFGRKHKKKVKKMKITLKIEGMMCAHCEAHVKKALESFKEVEFAEVSHKMGTAIVSLNEEIGVELLKKAVNDLGYKA